MTNSNFGPEWTKQIIAELETQGCFKTGIQSVGNRRRGGFQAVNIDVMDHNETLAVLQVREAFKRKSSHFLRVRKNYFLIGRNDDGNAFAHPVDVRSTNANVDCALMKIWNCTKSQLAKVVRQGDVALIPVRGKINDAAIETGLRDMLVNESHFLSASESVTDGENVFVRGEMSMKHLRDQHPFVSATLAKWHRVQIGNRAPVWNFSRASVD